jgi:FixJ family two-component response regulator
VVGVIDDDASVRKALSRLFRTAGLEVLLFTTAEQYLSNPDRAKVGCLVIDVRLPGMSGFELHDRLRAQSNTPALFITAHQDEEARSLALSRGAMGLFLKPFDNRELLEVVFRSLGTGEP